MIYSQGSRGFTLRTTKSADEPGFMIPPPKIEKAIFAEDTSIFGIRAFADSFAIKGSADSS